MYMENVINVEDIELDVNELVEESKDPWLHALMSRHAATKTRANVLWALRAFLRYDYPKRHNRRFSLENRVKHGIPKVEVIYARKRIKELREGHEEALVTACQTEAQELESDLRDAFNRSMEGEKVTVAEWKSLCIARENLLVAMQTLAPTPRTPALVDFINEVDELGYQILVSNTAGITFESEQLWRGVLAGDSTWWLRSHALE